MKTLLSLTARLSYKLMNWKFEPLPDYFLKKHVIIGFPHTTNMDTIRAFLGFRIVKRTGHIMVKREWFFWPISSLLRALGGIPVFRDSPQGVVNQMVKMFSSHETFLLAIVPEGTRKGVSTIKTGFWHIAKEADVSILCWYLDNDNKITRWLGEVIPGADKAGDMIKIQKIYADAGYSFPLDIPSLNTPVGK